jgi:CHAT domain-containing protein/Flp pilus assembly protein TadD
LCGGRRPLGSAIEMALVSVAIAILAGCRPAAPPDPAAIFENIRNDSLHGNLDLALQKAQKARNDFSASNADWAMKFRVLEAEILTYQGRRPDVLALLNDPHVSYPGKGDLAIKRYLLCGMAHDRLGQAQQADLELQEAQRLSDASHSGLNGEVLRTQAVVQNHRGQLANAGDLFRKSLKVAREERDTFLEASDLFNLGMVDFEMEHYDEALASLNEAASFARSVQARLVLEAALGNLGAAYFQLGDFEKALSGFQQAEQASREIGTTSAQVDWLWDAGSAYSNLGNLQQARECYEQSLKAAKAIDNREEIAAIEADLAFLLFQQGQFDSAKAHSDEAIRSAHASGDQAGELEPLFLQALLAEKQLNGQDPERMLMQVYGKSEKNPSMRGQIENALANLYAGKKQNRQAELWYRKSILTFEDQRTAIKQEELRLPFFANGDTLYRDYADFLISSQKQEQALELLDVGRAKTLAEGLGLEKQRPNSRPDQAADPQSVARKLDSTVLFYSLGQKKSWLWAVTPHHTSLFSLPGQSDIETQVRSYQNAILKSSDPLREANQAARNLYDTLVMPAAEMVPKGSRVLIIPDGVLNGLNFETLLTPPTNGSHYWIEDVTIRSANSIHTLTGVDASSSAGSTKKLLLIGNPTTAGTGYDSLVNAFAEIRGIEKHFPPDTRTVVTQSGAVPAAYAENKPEEFSYIHFVAHGTASRLDPLDSAVVLSPSPDNPENFKLYARDIMRDPLHARLVTISACYGSGLRAYAGEGLVGLSWAFLRAGAHNVIGALWEVNDASTPLLMDKLYAELEAGNSPDAALRAAKLSLIHSPAVYRKPLYWAGFQLYTRS